MAILQVTCIYNFGNRERLQSCLTDRTSLYLNQRLQVSKQFVSREINDGRYFEPVFEPLSRISFFLFHG